MNTSSLFDEAERGHSLSPARYDAQLPMLRAGLLEAQQALRDQRFATIVIVAGSDAAGKGELVQRLNEWLDPRGVETQAFWNPTEEECERPPYWRFWRALPARGRLGIFFGSWYTHPLVGRAMGELKRRAFEAGAERIARFEQMLVADGTLLVKLWLHLGKAEQKKRMKKLEAAGRLGPDDWKHFKRHDEFGVVGDDLRRRTDLPAAGWHVLDASDRRHRELTAGSILLNALRERLDRSAPPASTSGAPSAPRHAGGRRGSQLDAVDLNRELSREDYEELLPELQHRLGKLAWRAQARGVATVLAFEGWDAAGKGSAIRRVTQAIDPRLYHVVGIAAPTDEERAHHYLWRFWRQLPRAGFVTVFDRSWYGRVLVERVEGFATPPEWSRAYEEIADFENQLLEHGVVLAKFWLHISPDEQLRRFKERQTVRYKRYKITAEDWRNREKWDAYKLAVDEMLRRCSTEAAPWCVVAGNNKRSARVQILRTVIKRLEAAL